MMVKIMPTYATRKALIERRIQAMRNDRARYINHGWLDAAEDVAREIVAARMELKALRRG